MQSQMDIFFTCGLKLGHNREIESKTHYVPLHMSPQGQRLGYRADDLMEASKCFETLLRLPVHGQMVGEQMEFVAGMVLKACGL